MVLAGVLESWFITGISEYYSFGSTLFLVFLASLLASYRVFFRSLYTALDHTYSPALYLTSSLTLILSILLSILSTLHDG